VADHEAALTAVMLTALGKIDGIQVFGDPDPARARERLGVTTFRIDGVHHKKATAILGHEGGIGVRTGMFCAHPYVQRLLGLSGDERHALVEAVRAQERSGVPGLIRASFGLYNCEDEIEAFIEALTVIVSGAYEGDYVRNPDSGAYMLQGAGGWGTRRSSWSPSDCT